MLKRLITILSIAALPCSLLAQEATKPDTLKVKTLGEKEQNGTVFNAEMMPSHPKTLSFDDKEKRTEESATFDPSSFIDTSNPKLPAGLQGASSRSNFIGLGATNSATLLRDFNYGNLSFSPFVTAQKHFYDYRNVTMFTIGGSVNYAFNDNWSATAYGHYVTGYAPFRPAVQPMMPVSGFGGYITYDAGPFSISGGVRRDFNPYTMSWETNPVVIPTVKIGDFKFGIDIGPALKYGVENMRNDKRHGPPPPPPDGNHRR